MIRELLGLLFQTRLDRMTWAEIEQAAANGTLTLAEIRRLAKAHRYASGLSR